MNIGTQDDRPVHNMKLIIGLGNPGKKYETTRHNVGFLILDKLISNIQYPIFKLDKKLKSEISKKPGSNLIIAKPQTFMNESGVAVRALCDFYKIKPADVIVVHDDKDIPLGEYKIQTNRGPAGHNGVISIITHLGTQDFTRVRVGIKTDKKIDDTANFVLDKFSKAEIKILDEVIKKVVKEIKILIV